MEEEIQGLARADHSVTCHCDALCHYIHSCNFFWQVCLSLHITFVLNSFVSVKAHHTGLKYVIVYAIGIEIATITIRPLA